MSLESYRISRRNSHSNPREEMRREKMEQIKYLYEMAMDREEGCTLNGREFVKSPRIFDSKTKLNYFQLINVETIEKEDYLNSGDILEYDGDHYICIISSIFHNMYSKGTFAKCNYLLRWQVQSGEIIERYCWIQSAAQYNSGEDGNRNITLGTDQLMIILPMDEYTTMLDDPNSFFIDYNKKKPTPYNITRNDIVPYTDFCHGCVNLIVTQRQVTEKDNVELMICDYVDPNTIKEDSHETSLLFGEIIGRRELKCGYSRTYSAKFTNESGEEVTCDDFEWNVISTFPVKQTLSGSKIILEIDNEDCVGSSFILQVTKDSQMIVETTIHIVSEY